MPNKTHTPRAPAADRVCPLAELADQVPPLVDMEWSYRGPYENHPMAGTNDPEVLARTAELMAALSPEAINVYLVG